MDEGSPGGRVRDWVLTRFQGRDSVTKEELVAGAAASNLPEETRAAIDELPEGSWSPARAIHQIVDILETRATGGARGNANIPGAGGYGRSF